ncbi:hypothetical protein ACVIJ6_001075 [Bradyrhizobium sp. USDA 4369]
MTCEFGFDEPELAFQQMLSALMSQPLLYDSMKAVRVNANGTSEAIFSVSMYFNPGTRTYDYTPSFTGSWRPPEAFRAVQHVPR